jgi:molybdenum cofactor biosynthesis protein MoaC
MVSISAKIPTVRLATARCTLHFSNPTAYLLIQSNAMKKGDVLSIARIAGIMAAKKTSDLIPLCHPIAISHVSVELHTCDGESAGPDEATKSGNGNGRVEISATVTCEGKTGVEMEALTAASVAGLTVYDMCKAVDKGIWIEGLRVIRKEGGKSGVWVEGEKVDDI